MATTAAIQEYRAEARFQRVSPQKARLVLDLIKGRGVEEALTVAQLSQLAPLSVTPDDDTTTPERASRPLR